MSQEEQKPEKKKKLKLIAYCDSPVCFSGFGQVSRNILGLLHETGLFDITCFGVNHHSESDNFGRRIETDVPYDVLEASYLNEEDQKKGYNLDMLGRNKLMKLLYEQDFDVFWSVQDPYVIKFLDKTFKVLKGKFKKKFKSIFYFPVDALKASTDWCISPRIFDHPVVYTYFGEKVVKDRVDEYQSRKIKDELISKELDTYKEKLTVIQHGTNTDDFFPIDEESRHAVRTKLEIDDKTCVVLNVSRNQPRKDLARTLHIFSEFKKLVPDSVLILYCRARDVGGDLRIIMSYYHLEEGRDIVFPDIPDDFKGSDISEVNQAYGISDMVISTTLGEGWGLPITEAMATRIPVIFPANTSINEIVGKNNERGFTAKCGSTKSEWIHLSGQNLDDPPRPLTNVDDMVEKMLYVWENRGKPEVLDKVEAAYKWIQERTWKKIFKKQWLPIFKKIHDEMSK